MHDLSLNKIGQNGAKGVRFELGFDGKEGKSILTEVNQAFSSAKGFSRQMITGEPLGSAPDKTGSAETSAPTAF